MRLVSLTAAAAVVVAAAFHGPFGVALVEGAEDGEDPDWLRGQGGGQPQPHGEHDGGPLVRACKDLAPGKLCKVDHRGHRPGAFQDDEDEPPEEDEDTLGVCQEMLDGEVHCHILHPSARSCLDKVEGTNCTFKHRGLDQEEKGKCEKMPHGMACMVDHDAMRAARERDGAPDDGSGGHHGGPNGGHGHVERFAQACSGKVAGDECSLEMPNGEENEFKGVCEDPAARRHRHGADDAADKESKRPKKERPLRCRMLSPMEASCLGKQEGTACNITMHARGAAVTEPGLCKEAVRGEMHCRHQPRARGGLGGGLGALGARHERADRGHGPARAQRPSGDDDAAEQDALGKALRGIGEANARPDANQLRSFPAPKHPAHPAPSDDDDDDDPSKRVAPAPKQSDAPAPEFEDDDS